MRRCDNGLGCVILASRTGDHFRHEIVSSSVTSTQSSHRDPVLQRTRTGSAALAQRQNGGYCNSLLRESGAGRQAVVSRQMDYQVWRFR
jgi:hypothetical protein